MSRAEQIQKMLDRSPNDAFLTYALAIEHRKAGDVAGALNLFSRTAELDGNYAYAHFQRGQIFEQGGNPEKAREAYAAGVAAAVRSGDRKAAGEIGAALEAVPE